jgi:hypothetical protein
MDRAMADSATEVAITRAPVGPPVFDPQTGDLTPVVPTLVYAGPCLLTPVGDRVTVEVRGGEDESSTRFQLSVPLDAPEVLVGDEVTITSDPDPRAVDRSLWVSQVLYGSGVARRSCIAVDKVVAARA